MARHVHSYTTAGSGYTCNAALQKLRPMGRRCGPQVRLVRLRPVSALGALSGLRRDLAGIYVAIL